MFTVLGYSITIERFIIIFYLIAAVGLAWFLTSVLRSTVRKVKQIDGRKLVAEVSSMASKAANTTGTMNSQYRPAFETALSKILSQLAPHFSFQGAASRKQFILTQLVIGAVLGFFLGIGILMYASWSNLVQMLGILLILASFCVGSWLLWAVSAKRVRDTGVTVWWVLSLLVPPLNLATLVFMLLVPTNEFEGRGL